MAPFGTGLPPDIYAFHRYTWNSAIPWTTQVHQFRRTSRGWAPDFHPRLSIPPTLPLSPVIPNNARHLRLTAAAGTELAVAYSCGTVTLRLLPALKEFTTRRPSSSTRRRSIRVSPIVKNSRLLPPVGVWTVSQFQCGWSSSQTSYPS